MANKITGYKTEDGRLFASLEEAKEYDENRIESAAYRKQQFLKQMESLPKYGKYVNSSNSSFRRNIATGGALDVLKDLSLNYSLQYTSASLNYDD
jgi:hypothetical protein